MKEDVKLVDLVIELVDARAPLASRNPDIDSLAASFQEKIAQILSDNLTNAAKEYGFDKIAIAGGVSANTRLRELIEQKADGRKFYAPRISLCGDNGAMIAAQGYYEFINGKTAGLDLNGIPSLPIDFDC